MAFDEKNCKIKTNNSVCIESQKFDDNIVSYYSDKNHHKNNIKKSVLKECTIIDIRWYFENNLYFNILIDSDTIRKEKFIGKVKLIFLKKKCTELNNYDNVNIEKYYKILTKLISKLNNK